MRAILTDGLAVPPSRDPGPEPVMDWLPVEKLVIDREYQREVNKTGRRAIEEIARRFEWTKFGAVTVAPVSLGRYAIIDGQHRVTAAKLIGVTRVPCVIQALDRAGQAAAFSAINGSVVKITPNAIYRAALAAGEGWAVAAERTCRTAGCRLMTSSRSAAQKNAGEIYAVTMMRDVIDRHGEATVTCALTAYRQSVYGDLLLVWNSSLLLAWITAVATTKGAAHQPASRLAAFHDEFDILEHDDEVAAQIREIRRAGNPAAPRWQMISHRIGQELEKFLARGVVV